MIVAYDQSVREKAMSKPAPTAGAANNRRAGPDSSAVLLCCPTFFRRFDVARYDAVMVSSATVSVSIAQASAAKSADEKLIRTAMFPKGISDARWARMIHNGTPGGCAIPRPRATTISSPLSVRVTVGASVQP